MNTLWGGLSVRLHLRIGSDFDKIYIWIITIRIGIRFGRNHLGDPDVDGRIKLR
jgi:hypothetical protein